MTAKLPKTPTLTAARGFRAAGLACGMKASGKPDLMLLVADVPCSAAGVFTKNRVPGAPVIVGKRRLRNGKAQAILVNSGVANDATGQLGIDNAIQTTRWVSDALNPPTLKPPTLKTASHPVTIAPGNILPSSTGLIGPQLPMQKMQAGIAKIVPKLARGIESDRAAAAAIMTTDLTQKLAATSVKIGGKTVRLGGIAKGSGMIAPNMATMLVFLTTDAAIAPPLLKASLRRAAGQTFNRISVDQHTSPSDSLVCLASGLAGNREITTPNADADRFTQALTRLCADLAYQVVEDGEGATKVIRFIVAGARTESEADRVGRAVINSPLVKTAVHGSDPNWGRIVTAAGNSGVALTPEKMSLYIGGRAPHGKTGATCVYKNGSPLMDKIGTNPRLNAAMANKEVVLRLELDRGTTTVTWLGCDLSREYIRINADYTT